MPDDAFAAASWRDPAFWRRVAPLGIGSPPQRKRKRPADDADDTPQFARDGFATLRGDATTAALAQQCAELEERDRLLAQQRELVQRGAPLAGRPALVALGRRRLGRGLPRACSHSLRICPQPREYTPPRAKQGGPRVQRKQKRPGRQAAVVDGEVGAAAEKGAGAPGANGARNIVLGDLNTDPGRFVLNDRSARTWRQFVGPGRPFRQISEAGLLVEPTYLGLINIDHVATDAWEGDCWAASPTEIVAYDHQPIVCDLRPDSVD